MNVTLLNQGGGKLTVVLCADQRFSSYIGVEFQEAAHQIHFCKGTGPFKFIYQGSGITSTVVDGDNYTIYYQKATDTISVYRGTSGTPLGSWTDTTHSIPHGPGYRYAGFVFQDDLFSQGLQTTFWSAKDDV